MKKIVLVLITFISLSVKAQSSEALVDELFKVTQVYDMVPRMVNSIIVNYKTKVQGIPDQYWEEISNNINYTDFINESKKVYLDNYTQNELEELISLYNPETIGEYQSKVKKIEPALYQLGKEFGKNTMQSVNEKLQAYNK